MQQNRGTILGTGWSFPPAFDRAVSTVQMVSNLTDIEQSIFLIITTLPGERLMQPEFGCYLSRLVFEIVSATFLTEVNDIIRLALLKFEPRIIFNQADLINQDINNGITHIRIDFSVITTNTRHNVVYPYYFEEGSNIRALT